MAEACNNERRRDRAAQAVEAYERDEAPRGRRRARLCDAANAAEALCELLCDLHHLADEFDLDWYALARDSERFHAEEEERFVVQLTTEGFQIRDTGRGQLKAEVFTSRAPMPPAPARR